MSLNKQDVFSNVSDAIPHRQKYYTENEAQSVETDIEEINYNPPQITVYDYTTDSMDKHHFGDIADVLQFKDSTHTIWINIDGFNKQDVELVSEHYNIHTLLVEYILSIHHRPKLDEINDVLFCLLNMLHYNKEERRIETKQVSIALGKNWVISFRHNSLNDIFGPLRERLHLQNSKMHQRNADYLFYCILDIIVDNYFTAMEHIGREIALLEDEVIHETRKDNLLIHINKLRKELMVLRDNIIPVREIIGRIIHNDTDFLDARTTKYFRDISDHTIQAFEIVDNYSSMLVNVQDLYISNVNLKLNGVMKIIAVVTCLLAPAAVISGIFGMNFAVIPEVHSQYGFYIVTAIMLIIPAIMLWVFKRNEWF